MTIDPDTVQLASRHLTAAGFAAALLATLGKKYWGYAAFSLLALIEAFADLRYPFHGWIRDMLLGTHEQVGAKAVLQSTLLYVTGMLGCFVLLILVPYLARVSKGRRYMVIGSLIIAAMLSLELISPHYIDAVIYHPEGPFARSAIAYFIGGVAIAGGALMTRRRR